MRTLDPQFFYVVLILPTLFGLTLVSEGITKIIHEEVGGWLTIAFGLLFIIAVIFTFLFFLAMARQQM